MITKNAQKFVLFSALVMTFAFNSEAKERFKKEHPRRAEVLARKRNEKAKNDAAVADGSITAKQGKHLDHEDNKIKKQEEADAAAHGGHITQGEQNHLNHEENRVNQQRTSDQEKNAAAAAPAAPAAPAAAAPVAQ